MGRRGRVIAGLVVVAVAIAAVVGTVLMSGDDDVAPIGAVAAIQDDFLPVVPIKDLPGRIDLIAATGVTTTRVDVFWADTARQAPADPADPADAAYDWSRTDRIFRGLAENGIDAIVSVYNTPPWAGLYPATDGYPLTFPINAAIPDPAAFGAFMTALATRYSGTYVPPGAAEPLPEVKRFEIWNEPNLSRFLAPQTTEDGARVALDRYAEMARAAYTGIKSANPAATVIAGVAGPRGSSSRTTTGVKDWMSGLAERDIPLDAYSQHIYPNAGPRQDTQAFPSWSSVGELLADLDAFRDHPGLPLYITEAGYTTQVTAYRDESATVTDAQQAQYLTQIFQLPQLRTDRIRTVVWFNLQDNADWPAGLYRADGSKKPSYQAFLRVVEDQHGSRLGD
ncbi:MAG: cellulase family glycosylhydrolase [Thermoleophilia bacterium]